MSPRSLTTADFNEEVVKIRDRDFRLRELSIGEYDDLIKLATSDHTNPVTGEEEERTDNQLLLKLMVLKCVVDPKLTADKLSSMPMRLVLKLNQTVNKMHYGDEPSEEVKPEEVEDEEKKGNA